ncbi:MAG: TIGR02186 family protein [Chromatiaceae bacterium]
MTRLEADHVDVTSEFKGEQLLLFGALSRGGDVVIKVVSPGQEVALSRKEKLGPIWLDGGRVKVAGAPGLFYLLSTRPIGVLLGPAEQERYGLRVEVALANARLSGDATGMSDWRVAFLRLKGRKGYYLSDGQGVTVKEGHLFYASVRLPAKSPLGRYELSIYLVRDGVVVASQKEALEVRKVSLQRWVDRVAHEHGWLFGGGFTLGAMTIGLALGIILRQKREV